MNQVVSTGLQMMQVEVSIDQETLFIIRALNTINFDDLHKIICHKLAISSSLVYSFYLPKSETNVRLLTRSFDVSSTAKLAAYIQTGDMIYYRIYNSEFLIRFSSMGIVDEATAMQAKLLVTQSKIKHVLKKENITYRNEISNFTLKHLFKLAEQLFTERIYQYLPDHSFLMIHVNDMLQPIYVENQDDQFLLYFFQDEESYHRFVCVLKDTLPNQSVYKYKQANVLRFAKQPTNNVINHCCDDTYISFLDLQRGWELDCVSEEMAQDFFIVLPILLEAVRNMRNHNFQFSEKQGILHIYDLSNCPIRIEVKPYENLVLPILPYKAMHNIDVLLDTKIIDTYLEIDYRFIKDSHKAVKKVRKPCLLNVSAIGPSIQSHYEHSFEKEEDIRNAFLDMLVSIIEENGRPQVIKVKDRYVYSLIDDMCAKLGIFVKIEPRLLYIEAYYVDIPQVIYNLESEEIPFTMMENPQQPIKKAVSEQPLQHQYSRKRYKMKAYFN